MDSIVNKIVALGVPGLVLFVTMGIVGWSGAVAITTSLALLGGPIGMLGGIGLLVLLGLISHAIAEYGMERIYRAVLAGLREKGLTKQDILNTIEGYLITRGLKAKLKEYIRQQPCDDESDDDLLRF